MRYRRYRNPARRVTGGLSGGIILIGLALAFVFGRGDLFLPIFFIFLAFAIFIGSLGSLNPRAIYGSLIGAMWMVILAIFFLSGGEFWPIFLIGAALSVILGALMRPIIAALLGMGLFGLSSMMNNQPQQPIYYQPPQTQQDPPQQPYYQPPSQPTQDPSYQPYQQGYQPPPSQPQPEVYQEGGQQHQYPAQYDQPQAQYPQQQPPQQQQ